MFSMAEKVLPIPEGGSNPNFICFQHDFKKQELHIRKTNVCLFWLLGSRLLQGQDQILLYNLKALAARSNYKF